MGSKPLAHYPFGSYINHSFIMALKQPQNRQRRVLLVNAVVTITDSF